MNTEEISIEAFPRYLINDINELNKIVTLETDFQKTGPFEVFINSELIKIPYRIYVNVIDEKIEEDLSVMQRLILNSYYTRHHNGYIREARLKKIFTSDEEWVIPYVLNLVGEYVCEYFKYRKQAERLIKSGVNDIKLSALSHELESQINEFNRLRNWQNHIPESLLTSEISLVEEDKLLRRSKNPIEVYYYKYVSTEYFKDLYMTSINFYEVSRKIHQAVKRDYSLLIDESVEIKRIFTDKVRTIEDFNAAKKSAKIQGLKSID